MEKAILNVDVLYISQNMNSNFSHNGDLAIDISKLKYLKAPFTGKIKRKYSNCNGIWLESSKKVEYADGTIDYMTIMTLHDNDVSDLYINKKIKQNEIYYQPGVKGNVTGSHIHIAVGRGKFKGIGWYKGKYQPKVKAYAWLINNQYDITKALFLHPDVKVSKNSYEWKIYEEKSNNLKKSNNEIAKEVIQGKWDNGNMRKKRLEEAGYNYNEIQDLVNELLNNDNKYYIVQKGDTLWDIAMKYKVYWKDLYEENKDIIGDNPNLIKPGQRLLIKF